MEDYLLPVSELRRYKPVDNNYSRVDNVRVVKPVDKVALAIDKSNSEEMALERAVANSRSELKPIYSPEAIYREYPDDARKNISLLTDVELRELRDKALNTYQRELYDMANKEYIKRHGSYFDDVDNANKFRNTMYDIGKDALLLGIPAAMMGPVGAGVGAATIGARALAPTLGRSALNALNSTLRGVTGMGVRGNAIAGGLFGLPLLFSNNDVSANKEDEDAKLESQKELQRTLDKINKSGMYGSTKTDNGYNGGTQNTKNSEQMKSTAEKATNVGWNPYTDKLIDDGPDWLTYNKIGYGLNAAQYLTELLFRNKALRALDTFKTTGKLDDYKSAMKSLNRARNWFNIPNSLIDTSEVIAELNGTDNGNYSIDNYLRAGFKGINAINNARNVNRYRVKDKSNTVDLNYHADQDEYLIKAPSSYKFDVSPNTKNTWWRESGMNILPNVASRVMTDLWGDTSGEDKVKVEYGKLTD